MKELTNKFSTRRVGLLVATEISERRRQILLQAGMMALVLIVIAFSNSFNSDYSYLHPSREGDPCTHTSLCIYGFMMVMFGCLSASIMFGDLSTKEGRTRMLMRPGKASEKFAARWIIYVAIYTVIFLISVVIADSLRCLLLKIRFPECHNIVPVFVSLTRDTLESLIPFRAPIAKAIVFGLGIYLAIPSFFVLGSVIWPRMSYPKTFGVFFAIFCGYAIACALEADMLLRNAHGLQSSLLSDHWYLIFTLTVYGAMAINYILAWQRLKETEVITTKR